MRAALLLALFACGDNLADLGTHSGTRLLIRRYIYTDGTEQRDLDLYHDALRDEPCRPTRWSDGARYCTPDAERAVFVDDSCTRALGRVLAGTPPPRYFARTYSIHNVAYPSRLYAAGAAAARPQLRWELRDSFCLGPFPVDETYDYYELGAEQRDLVRVKRADPHGGDRLQIIDDTSDDGLRAAVGISDRQRNDDCTPLDRPNATDVECVPADSALASYFHDPQCTQVALAIDSLTIPSVARQLAPATSCWTYFAVAEEITAPALYEMIGGTCMLVATPGGARFFLAGEPADIAHVTREHEIAERRLRRITSVIDDPLLYDSELGTDCVRQGNLCVPTTTARVQPFFADDGCQIGIDLALVPSGSCDAPSAYAHDGNAFRPVLARYTQPIYELSTGDTCGLYEPDVPLVAYTVGPPLADDTFVAVSQLLH